MAIAVNPITGEITPLGEVVASGQPQYYVDIAARNNELVSVTFPAFNSIITQFNTSIGQINSVSAEVQANATLAETKANEASASAIVAAEQAVTSEEQANIATVSASTATALASIDYAGFTLEDGQLVVNYYDPAASTPSIVDGEFIITY